METVPHAAELLSRYARSRDAEAFAGLVQLYGSMVLATCRRKLWRTEDVDDAVQETFLKLAREAGSLRSNLAAWLHRCALNVSIDLNRRAETRSRHERAAAAAAAAAAVTSDAQRELMELRDQIDAALARLDDADRELVLDRYFVGRSQVEMAAAADVSSATISNRLNVAIERLRTHLNVAGVPVAAVAALTAALAAEKASAQLSAPLTAKLNAIGLGGVGAVGSAAGFAWLKGVGIAVSIVTFLTMVICAMGWLDGSPAPIASTTRPAAAASVVTQSGGTSATPVPHWQAAAGRADGALFGRITDARGNAVPNAKLTLQGPSYDMATTDANGEYRFPRINGTGEYHLGVKADGFVPVDPWFGANNLAIQLAAGGPPAQRDFVLDRGVATMIHLVDDAGNPVPSVRITHAEMVERPHEDNGEFSDADGIVELTLPVTDRSIAILANLEGYAPTAKIVRAVDVNDPLDVTINLTAGQTVEGTAVDADGKPATGWTFLPKPQSWPFGWYGNVTATVDAAGHFQFAHVVPGLYHLDYTIASMSGGNGIHSLGEFDLLAARPLKLSLPVKAAASLASLKGRVNWVGQPRQGTYAEVVVRKGDKRGQAIVRYESGLPDADAFQIAGLDAGEYELSVEGPQLTTIKMPHVRVPNELPTIDVNVEPPTRISGVVTSAATTRPIQSFAVRVRKLQTLGGGPNYVPQGNWTQVSDADGRYDIELVGPGEYQVQIATDGYAWAWSKPARAETLGAIASADVKLTAGGSVRGIVNDEARHAIAGAQVVPWSRAQFAESEVGGAKHFDGNAGAVVTDSEGRFEVKNLAAGDEAIQILQDGYAIKVIDGLHVAEGRTTEVPTITLSRGCTVQGAVIDAVGNPVAGAKIDFKDSFAFEYGNATHRLAQTVTDSQGRYRVEQLPAQPIWVQLDHSWDQRGVVQRLIRPREATTQTLDFGGPAGLRGRLTDHGKAVANHRLYLSSGDRTFGGVMAYLQTDADGRFPAASLPAGRYVLYSEAGRENVPLREVSLGGETLDLGDVRDDRATLTVRLIADDPADESARKFVSLTQDAATFGWGLPLSPGTQTATGWTFEDAPLGHLQLTVGGADNFAYAVQSIDRTAADTGELTVHLPPRRARLRYVPTTQPIVAFACLVDAQGVDWGNVGWKKPFILPLPAGTYRVYQLDSRVPLGDSPLELRDGETTDFSLPTLLPERQIREVQLRCWSADGVLRTDADVLLTDAVGHTFKPQPWPGHEITRFFVPTGRYVVQVRQSGRTEVQQPIEIGLSSGVIELTVAE